jgi:hypothetical protein
MTIFDLLFLLLAFLSLVSLITAAFRAVSGNRARAMGILRRLGMSAVAYIAIVAVVGVLSPRRVLRVGDPWCFDDWCLSVERVERTPAPPRTVYTVSLRISSEARRVSQRAKGAWIYIIDQRGNRYAPAPDPSETPLDVLLQPGESVLTSRTFSVPSDAGAVGLITGHGVPCCYPSLIIADDSSLFHKRTSIRLD